MKTIDERLTFTGSLQLPDQSEASPVVVLIRQDRFGPHDHASVNIVGGFWAHYWQNKTLPETIKIVLKNESGRIELARSLGTKLQLEQAELVVAEWMVLSGSGDVPDGARVMIRVDLSAQGYVKDRRSVSCVGDGVVKRHGELDPQPEWKIANQKWVLGVFYHYEELEQLGFSNTDKALISAARISGDWRATEPAQLSALLEGAIASVVDPLRIYSFLSRQRVDWYRIRASYSCESRANEYAVRRKSVKRSQNSDVGPMFPQGMCSDLAFPTLLRGLATCGARDAIARAMDFVVDAWSADGMSSAVVLLHAALETVIGVIDHPGIRRMPTTRQLKNLEKSVRQAITTTTAADGWEVENVTYVLKKIGELKRPPIVELVMRYVLELKINIDDLWRSPEEFRSDLGQAMAVRNGLVHAAREDASQEARDRIFRLGLLTERMILRVLGLEWAPATP